MHVFTFIIFVDFFLSRNRIKNKNKKNYTESANQKNAVDNQPTVILQCKQTGKYTVRLAFTFIGILFE